MKRRRLIIGAGGLLALGAGLAASETGTLLGEPSDLLGTSTEPGVFSFDSHGVSTVGWYGGSGKETTLRVEYQSTLPDFCRLHRPDGRLVWEIENPSGTYEERSFNLPLTHPGNWELVAEQDGSFASLQLPVSNAFSIDEFGLSGSTLAITVSNPTDSPNYLEYLRLSHQETGAGEEYKVNQVLMPDESYSMQTEYPYNHYKGVELWVVGGQTVELTKSNKDFV